jgi:hypothetical protein
MPVSFRIDAKQRLVVSTLQGTVSEEEIADHNRRLRNDPAFDPQYQQLIDLRGLVATTASAD